MPIYTTLLGRQYERLYPMTQSELLSILAAAGILPGGGRIILAAPTTFYIATTGSDSNNGLTAGTPWLTFAHAFSVLTLAYDFGGQNVVLQFADGTYNTAGFQITSPWSGGGTLTLQGNLVTPDNVVLNITSGIGIFNTCSLPGVLVLQGFKLKNGGGNSDGIRNSGTGTVQVNNLDIGAFPGSHLVAGFTGSVLQVIGSYTISGGASQHFFAQSGGLVRCQNPSGVTITLSGTPAFSAAFAVAKADANMLFGNTVFSGGATGSRYNVILNAVINTQGSGLSFLPGNISGTTDTGGQYV